MANPYEIAYQQSIEDPDGFWGAAAEDCHWYKKWDKVLDDSNKPFYRWFSGGEMNTCYNMLDYHIENGRYAGLSHRKRPRRAKCPDL
jgi:propionyl-CoA synthetase